MIYYSYQSKVREVTESQTEEVKKSFGFKFSLTEALLTIGEKLLKWIGLLR